MSRHNPRSFAEWSRFLKLHALFGAALGILVGAGILLTDIARVGTLFLEAEAQVAIGALYFLSFAATFAAGSMATAIMGLARAPDSRRRLQGNSRDKKKKLGFISRVRGSVDASHRSD